MPQTPEHRPYPNHKALAFRGWQKAPDILGLQSPLATHGGSSVWFVHPNRQNCNRSLDCLLHLILLRLSPNRAHQFQFRLKIHIVWQFDMFQKSCRLNVIRMA